MSGPLKRNRNDLVKAFLFNPDNESMYNLVDYFRKTEVSDEEIARLAIGLANSGKNIIFPNQVLVDIPSTGGPSSLSTLLCPLILCLLGQKVLKLGVPGRPAGGIDVLAQIRNYNIFPNDVEVREWFGKTGYVHFLAGSDFAPLDAQLFEFRKSTGALNVPPLVIASLLAKKIAVGLSEVGLDVRVGRFGNFGSTYEEATENGMRFIQVAKLAGINARCFLTDADIPQQPYLGRGEAILALNKIFDGDACSHLNNHLGDCIAMALVLSGKTYFDNSLKEIKTVFCNNLKIQGGSDSSFMEIAKTIESRHSAYIYAVASGFLNIDLYLIRDLIVQANEETDGLFPDTCGVVLKTFHGNYISKGSIICSYRYELGDYKNFETALESAFTISEDATFINRLKII